MTQSKGNVRTSPFVDDFRDQNIRNKWIFRSICSIIIAWFEILNNFISNSLQLVVNLNRVDTFYDWKVWLIVTDDSTVLHIFNQARYVHRTSNRARYVRRTSNPAKYVHRISNRLDMCIAYLAQLDLWCTYLVRNVLTVTPRALVRSISNSCPSLPGRIG